MAGVPRGGRGLTILAVGFLALDAVLLALAGLKTNRWSLLVTAAVFLLMAWGVTVLWRRQLSRLDELGRARAALKDEVRHLRSLVQGQDHPDSPTT
ncbi:MAG: hypothetical protein ABJC74_06410 [Gemmatimonadota bacterium]